MSARTQSLEEIFPKLHKGRRYSPQAYQLLLNLAQSKGELLLAHNNGVLT